MNAVRARRTFICRPPFTFVITAAEEKCGSFMTLGNNCITCFLHSHGYSGSDKIEVRRVCNEDTLMQRGWQSVAYTNQQISAGVARLGQVQAKCWESYLAPGQTHGTKLPGAAGLNGSHTPALTGLAGKLLLRRDSYQDPLIHSSNTPCICSNSPASEERHFVNPARPPVVGMPRNASSYTLCNYFSFLSH